MSGVNAYVAGWNRGSWSSGPWNRSAVPIATGAVDSVTVVQGTGVSVSVTGSTATGNVGAVTITNKNNFSVTGVAATGLSGGVLVWSPIVPSQSSSFSQITPSQSSSFSEISPSQDPDWTNIAA
jgi:hypothetical protein|tara:strand:- start:557 stop:928 length:372 start_codon:yes stop_codon:yes gene_type:complete